MSIHPFRKAIAVAVLSLLPAAVIAGDISIEDPYARASRPNAPTGAVFMLIHNKGDMPDWLISVASDVAKRVELHTHVDQGDGILKMTEIEGGIGLPAGASHIMQRGGDHVMLMGLTQSLEQGSTISLTLVFEGAGDVEVEVPVDNLRKPK